MAQPILVTGGAGYIGSHVCKALATAGFTPVSYDNLCRGHRWAVKWGPLVVGDIADRDRLAAAIHDFRPLALMHFAGFGYVGESMADPALYYANNIAATHHMLEVLRQTGPTRLVFSSSCSVYGGVHERPIAEDAPLAPISTYGFSKLAIEHMLADYARAYDFRSISLRYFNAAGADPGGEIGECHDPEPHFVPLVLRAAAQEIHAIELFGDDYPTPDGTCVRDFIHVSDLADAHVLAVQALLSSNLSGAFNLGNGAGFSLRQVIDVAREVTGRPISVVTGPRRVGDPPYAVGDCSSVSSTLGWVPRYSGLRPILSHAWEWHLKYARIRGVVSAGRSSA